MKTMYSAAGSALSNTKFLYQNNLEEEKEGSIVESVDEKSDVVDSLADQIKKAVNIITKDDSLEKDQEIKVELLSLLGKLGEIYLDRSKFDDQGLYDYQVEIFEEAKKLINLSKEDLSPVLGEVAEMWQKRFKEDETVLQGEKLIDEFKLYINKLETNPHKDSDHNARLISFMFQDAVGVPHDDFDDDEEDLIVDSEPRKTEVHEKNEEVRAEFLPLLKKIESLYIDPKNFRENSYESIKEDVVNAKDFFNQYEGDLSSFLETLAVKRQKAGKPMNEWLEGEEAIKEYKEKVNNLEDFQDALGFMLDFKNAVESLQKSNE